MGPELTYKSNTVRELRRLIGRRNSRAEQSRFVVEGATLIAEGLRAGWTPLMEFVAPDTRPVVSHTDSVPVHRLAAGVIERVATTASPQPNIAVFELDSSDIALSDCSFVLVADHINDPGNLGTMLRSAEASGVDVVVVTPGTTDPFSPKVVRASAGAVFHVPVRFGTISDVAAAGMHVWGTSSHRGVDYQNASWTPPLAIVMGSEAHGLAADAPVDEWVRIPHRGRAESLNVAMATTLVVFAATRQLGNVASGATDR